MDTDAGITNFRRNFLTGLAAVFPLLICLLVLNWLYVRFDKTIGVKVSAVCKELLSLHPAVFHVAYRGAPLEVVKDAGKRAEYARRHFPAFVGVILGLMSLVALLYLFGLLLRRFVGANIVGLLDRFFVRIPIVRSIYPAARRVADFMFGSRKHSRFRRVVAVQYPRQGVYSVGFLTAEGIKVIERRVGRSYVSVFVPTSPAPLTGFVVVVPREEVIELDMTVQEAFQFYVTAGMAISEKPSAGHAQSPAPTSR